MIKCPNCNHPLTEFIEGSSMGVRCSHCDYEVVTTYVDPIYEDDTIYSIVLEKNNAINKDTVGYLMTITGLNIPNVSDLIKNRCPYVLFKGKAVDVKKMSIRLEEKGIKYKIIPKFDW